MQKATKFIPDADTDTDLDTDIVPLTLSNTSLQLYPVTSLSKVMITLPSGTSITLSRLSE